MATIWTVNGREPNVVKALKKAFELNTAKVRVDAALSECKNTLVEYGKRKLLRHGMPETPIYIQNKSGERVTLVVQDRSKSIKDMKMLREVAEKARVSSVFATQKSITFDSQLIQRQDVFDKLSECLTNCVSEMVESGMIGDVDAERLVSMKEKQVLIDGFADQILKDPAKVKRCKDFIEKACTIYVKI